MDRGGPQHTRRRFIGTVAGLLHLTVACAAFAVRYAPLPSHFWVFFAVAAPFLLVAAPLALAAMLWARQWMLSALAAGLTAVVVAVQVPLYVGAAVDGPSVTVRVMTINMLEGTADAPSIAAIADDSADVLMVEELTPEGDRRLRAADIARRFPYHLVDPQPEAAGAGIYSRYPIEPSASIGGLQRVMVSTRIHIDGVTTDPIVAAVHLASPWPRPIDGWHRDLDSFPSILNDLAAEAGNGPIIIGGDFNATIDMRPFRRLLVGGYRDASEQAGMGRQFTYKSGRILPPFMGIDHVLTRNATAVSTETVTVPDSDHRALLATVQVPRG